MAQIKEQVPFRTLDPDDEATLEAYAAACDAEKSAKEAKEQLREEVAQIIAREDTDKELIHDRFAYSVQWRRKWNPKWETQEREIDVNGQFIQASVKQLKNATTRLGKLVKTPDMEDGHTMAISATRGR